MTQTPRPEAESPTVHSTYARSGVPGLYCSTLIDAGPPRARVHDRLVLFTLLAGVAVVRCRGEVHSLQPGSLLIVEPGEVHRDLQKTRYHAGIIVLRTELLPALGGPDSGSRFGPVVARAPGLCVDAVALIDSVLRGDVAHDQERLTARLFRELRRLSTARGAPAPEPPLVARVRRAIAESDEVSLSLAQLAGRLRCAPNYLCRIFAAHMGMAPHAYQLQHRVLRARALVEKGDTVAEAARATGFSDESHLRRHFRRRFAASPSQYQQELSVGRAGVDPDRD